MKRLFSNLPYLLRAQRMVHPTLALTNTITVIIVIVTTNLIDVIQGCAPSQKFNGYTSCPLLIKEGKAMLVEFNYDNNLTPSVPLVDPLKKSYFARFLEEMMLKPAYMAVAKGRG